MSRTNWSLAFVLLVGAGCQQAASGPLILRSGQEYLDTLKKVEQLTRGPFEAMHEGHPVSDREKGDLKEAEHLIDALIAYKADSYSVYILKGLTRRALGNQKGAIEAYEQGLNLRPKEMTDDDKAAVGRLYDEMGTLYFEMGEFANAEKNVDEAVRLVPDDPSILTNAASVKVQLKKTSDAKALISRALKTAPDYQRAKDINKLLQMASPTK